MSMRLDGLFSLDLLGQMLDERYVRAQMHTTLPLVILNYSEKAAYDGLWNDVTLQCRGLIYHSGTLEVVARPFPKFFNYGQPGAPDFDLEAPVIVTEKMDGSLGIVYPVPGGCAIATRGSFTSDQAIHATQTLRNSYPEWQPMVPELTYLFEIVYPENRIVVDYGTTDDLFLLEVLETESGCMTSLPHGWPGPEAHLFEHRTLAKALAAEPRPNREGFVIYFLDRGDRVKIKQDDYMALHRILTGTNARNVWEYAAVRACRHLIKEGKHWATYLGIDPARAAQLLEVGDDWLEAAGIPDEFYSWVHNIIDTVDANAADKISYGLSIASDAAKIEDRQARYQFVCDHTGPLCTQVMRIASTRLDELSVRAVGELMLRAWREVAPEPTSPWARTEDVA